ncbi:MULTISPECIES: CRISPR-associated helicase Cas3' [Clostridia]|uniref:CRISPR-associated helicase Cas3' n=1 Tax=Clostridia TaxID=186801 RepID=UPI000EA3C5F6|nr:MULTISPECIES: CRISPR-associated helicase Cas3' [Clostridia]NBJ69475.1 CRISPR-associated helicase Cas3' [Roseburia sp. 1XD42-34]RKI78550.1 CRISPR-associated helicase Cas3' [Clostridium sp. 1xD42-85]
MSFIAHIRQSDLEVQSVKDHLLEVKELAEEYGEPIGMKHLCGLAGLLHDFGKYSEEFLHYIHAAVHHPEDAPKRGSVDHSTGGAKLLYELLHTKNMTPSKALVAEVVGNAIISHHSYLHDFLTPELESKYLTRVRDKPLHEFNKMKGNFFANVMKENDFDQYINKASQELLPFIQNVPMKDTEKQLMFVTKFVFSALIDADRTNTRLFEEDETPSKRDYKALFETYYERLHEKIMAFQNHPNANTPINRLRSKMSAQCEAAAEKESGIYTLSIPTGGGKTLASLRYGLKHALLHHKKRIIYVVPYTTIIEQNAEEVRSILKDTENILEHHSNVILDDDDNDEHLDGTVTEKQKLKLAKDNWDAPIIFTTMVQFLNVFYAKGSRNIRRLHHLSEAVIVFDEVQKVPVKCISLFNEALNFLKNNCQSSILLCTATQPALDFVQNKLEIKTDAEIVENLTDVVDAFKRVEIIDKATDKAVATNGLVSFIDQQLKRVQSILVVLNTKKVVKTLYEELRQKRSDDIHIYHLSTSMCAAHRNDILSKLRKDLDNNIPVICISTQLIEAGVDISFDCVIRSLAGLDSIAQAAGRCNRHGEKDIQQVYVIDHQEEQLKHLKEIEIGKQITRRILIDMKRNQNEHGGNILSPQAMERYFQEFYLAFGNDLNYFIPALKKDMMELLTAPKNSFSYVQAYRSKYNAEIPLFITNSYRTAAEHFCVIDNQTTSVIVPYEDEGKEIITELSGNISMEDLGRIMRSAQHYTINLYKYELDLVMKNNGLVSFFDGKIYALADSAYNSEFGFDVEGDSADEVYMI